MAVALPSDRSTLPNVQALLSGVQWFGNMSYSDPDRALAYRLFYPDLIASPANFSPLRPDQVSVVHHALDASGPGVTRGEAAFTISGITNLAVTYGGNSRLADIRVANSTTADSAFSFYPDNLDEGGDIWLGNAGVRNLRPGSFDHFTILHEVGHAVGLKHPHQGAPILPAAFDHPEFTVMTYRSYEGSSVSDYPEGVWSYAQTFMIGDIAALQHLYGANYATNAGNTVYSWSPRGGELYVDGAVAVAPGANRIFQTIWDGGGIDAYDATAYTTNVVIDLTPGESSVLSRGQLANLGGGPNGGLARGNVYNALLHADDPRSLIENAIGGSANDLLNGNIAANTLVGRAGNDRILGGAGADRLLGGADHDRINGEGGADRIEGEDGNDQLYGDAGADFLVAGSGRDLLTGGDARDVLFGGGGADTFAFNAPTQSVHGAADAIVGSRSLLAFEGIGEIWGDLIDLRAIDADATLPGNQAFTFGRGDGDAGRAWVGEKRGGASVVLANVDADPDFDLEIHIADGAVRASAYSALDFLL